MGLRNTGCGGCGYIPVVISENRLYSQPHTTLYNRIWLRARAREGKSTAHRARRLEYNLRALQPWRITDSPSGEGWLRIGAGQVAQLLNFVVWVTDSFGHRLPIDKVRKLWAEFHHPFCRLNQN